jgi:hypothetical protein
VTRPLIELAELYHTGIVVDDVDAAKEEYSDLMGVTWGPEGEADVPVWMPEGARMMSFRYAYTSQGPHRLELVRPTPGTIWTVSGVGQAHHLGYWCDDVPAVSAELSRRGLTLRAKIGVDDPDADADFVMHQARSGVYIELVASSNRERMFGSGG